MLRMCAALEQHRDDVAERLPDLRYQVVALEFVVGIPADLPGDEYHVSARRDAVRIAARTLPSRRLQDVGHRCVLTRQSSGNSTVPTAR
jgi:hypothetical protein